MRPPEINPSPTREIMPEVRWLDVRLIQPHPQNPRHVDRAERFAAIVASMQSYGFWVDKPLLVRPFGDGYQAIGGNTRHAAAIVAGLASAYCCIHPMSDEEAIIRIAEDNLGDPFNWAEQAIYIAQNAIKDSKKGLSRVRLVQACTGKTGDVAVLAATMQGQVGELLIRLIEEQSVDLYGLLNSPKDKTRHLYEICRLKNHEDRKRAVGRLIDESLTIDQCRAIAQSVKQPPVTAASAPRSIDTVPEKAVCPAMSIAPLTPAVAKPPLKSMAIDNVEILTMELDAANQRVDLLERLIYDVFNSVGDHIPETLLLCAARWHVFDFKHKELVDGTAA